MIFTISYDEAQIERTSVNTQNLSTPTVSLSSLIYVCLFVHVFAFVFLCMCDGIVLIFLFS